MKNPKVETIAELNQNCDDLKTTLETLIDTQGLSYVLSSLAQVCYEKSDHLASNWQDKETAKSWDRIGNRLDTVETLATNLNL